ncbi:nitroreductase [Microbacterium aoyamense]|uniref:Nitroreductase n=1 Tax=Microbacterium aoyamense TaxID=344166 RepID=A0ABN2PBR3_9MICO
MPSEVMERMFTLAQLAPSWCNTQPWHVIVTSGDATTRFREGLVAHIRAIGPSRPVDFDTPRDYTGVYRERRRESGRQLYDALGIAYGDREARAAQVFRNWESFGAPHIAIVTTAAEQGTYGAVDTGVYTGCLLLAAQSLGIAAVPQGAFAYAAGFIREHFEIPADQKVLLGIGFGYAAAEHPVNAYRTNRASLDESIRFVEE